MKIQLRRVYAFNLNNRDEFVAAFARAVKPGSRVLDVGAGPGPYRKLFSHCEYRAHDFGEEPTTKGRYTKLDYTSDILNIPAPDQSFDVILCTEVLEHIPDPVGALGEFARILREGGQLLLTAPLGSLLHQEPFHFYGGYTPWWYRKFLSESGFEIVQLDRNMGFFSMFGQEALRFSSLIHPRRLRFDWRWPLLSLLWIVSFPLFTGLLPLLGRQLDRLNLETIGTVGYHVVAIKNAAVDRIAQH